MKLPKRLIERRDAFICENITDNDLDGFDMGYSQGVEDLMSEVQGLVEALDTWFTQVDNHGGDYLPGNYKQMRLALDSWRAFCEVEKDEK